MRTDGGIVGRFDLEPRGEQAEPAVRHAHADHIVRPRRQPPEQVALLPRAVVEAVLRPFDLRDRGPPPRRRRRPPPAARRARGVRSTACSPPVRSVCASRKQGEHQKRGKRCIYYCAQVFSCGSPRKGVRADQIAYIVARTRDFAVRSIVRNCPAVSYTMPATPPTYSSPVTSP